MSAAEPRYVRALRLFMSIAQPEFWDGLILGLAVAAVPFFLWLWITGN